MTARPTERDLLRPTAADALPPLTEKAFMAQVIELAHAFGFHTYHPWLSMRSERGWPDVTFCKPGRFFMAELKTDKGKTTAKQDEWIERLRSAGVPVFVWRPKDWDFLVDVLRAEQNDRGPWVEVTVEEMR